MNHPASKENVNPSYVVEIDNRLARLKCPYKNVWEHRIFALGVSRVQQEDGDFFSSHIKASELFPDDIDKPWKIYGKIKKIANNLSSTYFEVEKIFNNKKTFANVNVFSTLIYQEGVLYIKFNSDMKEYLLQLSDYFTKYDLGEFLRIKTRYGQKLFEYLKSWSDYYPSVKVSVPELNRILNTSKSIKNSFGNFKSKILIPTYKDITENTSLRYEYELIKDSHKVTHILFKFTGNSHIKTNGAVAIDNENFVEEAIKIVKNLLIKYGLSEDDAERISTALLELDYNNYEGVENRLSQLKNKWKTLSKHDGFNISLSDYIKNYYNDFLKNFNTCGTRPNAGVNIRRAKKKTIARETRPSIFDCVPGKDGCGKKYVKPAEKRNVPDQDKSDAKIENDHTKFLKLSGEQREIFMERALGEIKKLGIDLNKINRELLLNRAVAIWKESF